MILIGGAITFFLRFIWIWLFGRMDIPNWLLSALKFVPAAVMAALVFPNFFAPEGTIDMSWGNERLWAGLLAAGVAWWSKNMLFTILSGMLALYLLSAQLF
jgi:branched-subunit amino acid transport protein